MITVVWAQNMYYIPSLRAFIIIRSVLGVVRAVFVYLNRGIGILRCGHIYICSFAIFRLCYSTITSVI